MTVTAPLGAIALAVALTATSLSLLSLPSLVVGVGLGLFVSHGNTLRRALNAWLQGPRYSNVAASQADSYTYGLEHELLNLRKPDTLWLNMGYWKETDDFVAACRALADEVFRPLDLKPGARVLDCGIGCGDQDLHLLSLHPTAIVTAVTSEPQQARIAASRVSAAGLTASINIYTGDAVDPTTWIPVVASSSSPHATPLPFRLATESFDALIALDSCYHYSTRASWLATLLPALRTGARFACTDLVLGTGYATATALDRMLLRTALWYAGAPWVNFHSHDEYARRLREDAGLEDVVVTVVSEHVFPRFGEFVARHKASVGGVVDSGLWMRYEGAARLFGWLWKERLVDFVVAHGTKA
ncbi:hypothetical protein HDU86_002414 [Geranomyces michiganensis]|nr:hypothetical protein HDU86_002414 [Geranomyces michiganensis]